MNYQTQEDKIKEVLEQLYSTNKIDRNKLELASEDYVTILEAAQREEYIVGVKITKSKSSPIVWDDDVRITTKGANFIHPTEKLMHAANNFHFHNGDFRGSGFGSDIIVTNNWSDSVDDLKKYISTLPKEDFETGNELIEIVETQDFKKGSLSRFTGFLEEHPNVVGYVGKAIVWSLSNTDKLS
ncbi:hypothetical protein JZB01_002766 [Listeria monocytogenes]|nr:hypothetical protein [Listeria monocytogenes]EHD0417802.1 hypothetical protein [Listeria monocytogenes]